MFAIRRSAPVFGPFDRPVPESAPGQQQADKLSAKRTAEECKKRKFVGGQQTHSEGEEDLFVGHRIYERPHQRFLDSDSYDSDYEDISELWRRVQTNGQNGVKDISVVSADSELFKSFWYQTKWIQFLFQTHFVFIGLDSESNLCIDLYKTLCNESNLSIEEIFKEKLAKDVMFLLKY